MLGVIIIAVLFTGMAIAIAWAASRGGMVGLSRTIQTQSRAGSRTINSILVVIYFVFAIAVPLVFIIGNHDKSGAQVAGIKLTSADQAGRALFSEHCAVCHTLAAANAVGKIGPNLDTLKPSEATVLHTIAHGCVQSPTPAEQAQNCNLGFGTMPAGIIQGRDAENVASFVSKVAGHT